MEATSGDRLPADLIGAEVGRGPLLEAPEVAVQVVPQNDPGLDRWVHACLLTTRRAMPSWPKPPGRNSTRFTTYVADALGGE